MFGPFENEVFLTLRNSLLLSTLLNNSETWYQVSEQNIADLERVDENIMRQKFSLPATCPRIFLYLETGTMPARYIMIIRRLNFLKYILDEKLLRLAKLSRLSIMSILMEL